MACSRRRLPGIGPHVDDDPAIGHWGELPWLSSFRAIIGIRKNDPDGNLQRRQEHDSSDRIDDAACQCS